MLGEIAGMRIIISKFAYKTKTVVRGIADTHRPNRVKPLYRRVTIHIPLIYKVGNDIVCAPEWEARIRQAFQQSHAADVSTATPQNDLAAQWKDWAFSVGLR